MLIGLCLTEGSWAKRESREDGKAGYGRVSFFRRTQSTRGRVLLFYPFVIFQKRKEIKMKKTVFSAAALLVAIVCVFCFAACSEEKAEGLWSTAAYLEDAEFGEGAKTVEVEVKVEEKSVTFTLHTDAETLGDALLAHNLIAGEESEYGMYVKVVNGITADYDVDQSYWGFYKDGEYMMSGVDTTVIADGESYELVYTK